MTVASIRADAILLLAGFEGHRLLRGLRRPSGSSVGRIRKRPPGGYASDPKRTALPVDDYRGRVFTIDACVHPSRGVAPRRSSSGTNDFDVPSFVALWHTWYRPRRYSSAPRGAWSSRPSFGGCPASAGQEPRVRIAGRALARGRTGQRPVKAVLDASALLAYLQDEPGNETIEPMLD